MKFGMYYNKETIGDVLLVIYKSDVIPAYIEQRNDIVALFDKDNEIVGYNFLNISNSMKIKAHGQIPICSHQVIDILNYKYNYHNIKPYLHIIISYKHKLNRF